MRKFTVQVSWRCLGRLVSVAGVVFLLAACKNSSNNPATTTTTTSSTVTVTKAGTGTGTVTSTSPQGINCGNACTLTATSGTSVTLQAAPAANNTFVSWAGACTGTATTCTFPLPTTNSTVTATFNASTATPTLTTATAGTGTGTVTATCGGNPCAPPAQVAWGTQIVVTATPNAGSSFAGYGATCPGTVANNTCTFNITADTTPPVTATFTLIPPTVTLTVTKSGTGTVNSTAPQGLIACGATCSANNIQGGTPVTLTAIPGAGFVFTGWSGQNVNCPGTADCTLPMTADTTVLATFTAQAQNFQLTVTNTGIAGGSGTVTSNTGGITCGATCSASIQGGTAVVLTATPAAGSIFGGWTNCPNAPNPANVCSFTMSAATAVTATFKQPTLSVVVAGPAGSGSVTSNPGGITCGLTCAAPFSTTQQVTLTATPGGGFTFSGWSGGGCAGTGTCQLTLSADTTVTATFGTPAPQAATHFQFVKPQPNTTAGPLLAIDPATPTNAPAQVNAAGTTVPLAVGIHSGTWDAVNNVITNLSIPSVVYVSNGKLWKVQTAKSAGVPGSGTNPPVQISSEAGANNVCSLRELPNPPDLSVTRLSYELPGTDGLCATLNDNVTKLVAFGDGSAVAPTLLPTGLVTIGDTQGTGLFVWDYANGGALSYIFLVDGATMDLKRYDVSNGTIVQIAAGVGFVGPVSQPTSDRIFLRTGTTLYLYTISSNTLTALKQAGTTWVDTDQSADSTGIYLADASNNTIYKAPLTATSAADVSTFFVAPSPIQDLNFSSNRVILSLGTRQNANTCNTATDSSGLSSVPKAGGAATVLSALAANTCIYLNSSVNTLVYYGKGTTNSGSAIVVQEDGTAVQTFPNNAWAGENNGTSFDAKTYQESYSTKIVLATFGQNIWNGATLAAYDAANPMGTAPISLGTVPATPVLSTNTGFWFHFLYDSGGIATPELTGGTNNRAVFSVDVNITNSLGLVPTPSSAVWEEISN